MENINYSSFLIFFNLIYKHLHIYSILDFFRGGIELFLPKRQISVKRLLQSFCTHLRTVDISVKTSRYLVPLFQF